jgi:hypothetical protein
MEVGLEEAILVGYPKGVAELVQYKKSEFWWEGRGGEVRPIAFLL